MPRKGAKEWAPTQKRIGVPAITATDTDPRKKYEYPVLLLLDGHRWVLDIDGTPGKWYMSTILLGWPGPDEVDIIRIPERMYIDLGQGWYVENWREVVTEALRKI